MHSFPVILATLLACATAQRVPWRQQSMTSPTVPTVQPWPTGRSVPTGGPWPTGRPVPTGQPIPSGQPWATRPPRPTGRPWATGPPRPTGRPWPGQTGPVPMPRDGPNDNLINPPRPRQQQPAYRRSQTDGMDEVVAFSAYMNEPNVQSFRNTVIPFANVLTNIRNGYDSFTNAFRVPRRGVYSFFARLDCSSDYSGFNIVLNGYNVVATAHNDGGGKSLMTSVVLFLRQGSIVDVRHAGNVGSIDGGLESTFSGFRVGND